MKQALRLLFCLISKITFYLALRKSFFLQIVSSSTFRLLSLNNPLLSFSHLNFHRPERLATNHSLMSSFFNHYYKIKR